MSNTSRGFTYIDTDSRRRKANYIMVMKIAFVRRARGNASSSSSKANSRIEFVHFANLFVIGC